MSPFIFIKVLVFISCSKMGNFCSFFKTFFSRFRNKTTKTEIRNLSSVQKVKVAYLEKPPKNASGQMTKSSLPLTEDWI